MSIIKLSQYFGVSAAELHKRGVLNAHISIDNRLFVDPNLLKTVSIAEFKGARTDLEAYFAPVLKLLKASNKIGDIAWSAARKRLIFDEEHGTALGYSHAGESGRGIGPTLATILATRGKQIVDLGVDASEMFELIGLFQERFGPDLLSDMAVAILKERFLLYTQRITNELAIQRSKQFSVAGKQWLLPVHPNGVRGLILVPAELLTPLPVALDRSEIWEVAEFNAEVRSHWNAIITAASKQKRGISKSEIREMLFARPKNLADLIEVYRHAAGNKYDFDKDPDGLLSWEFIGTTAAESTPLVIENKQPKTVSELRDVLKLIILQFKKNVEDNKLYQVLYSDDGWPRREEFSQRLFFAIADTYCAANNVDLNREPNAGNGPVDFKLSAGYNARILVEVKKSTNSDLLHGFETQLPAYEQSEATQESIYLLMRVSEGESAIKDVLALREKKMKEGKKVPDVVVIDARKKASASKR